MNKALYDSFKKLDDLEKNELKFRLKDSPIALQLFKYLDLSSNRNFKTRDAVEFLYPNEIENASYSVLENRYFKLRKKFFDEWLSKNEIETDTIPDEESEFIKCKQLILKNQKDEAYHRLAQLEKVCWDKNIFEILPSIIDNMIFCNQSLNKINLNDALYSRQLKAIDLQADCHKMIRLARMVYDINYRKGVIHAKKQLAEIKDLGVKNKAYPRFIMCYHHVSVYYKLGSADYLNDMQVISRHYREYKQLNEKYPLMPLVSFRKNYVDYQHLHYKQIQTFYHYNRLEFEDAYLAMNDIWGMVNSENEIHKSLKTESMFYNMFISQRMAGRYKDAEKLISDFLLFLKENNNQAKYNYAYTMFAILIADDFPRHKDKDIDFYIDKVDDYIKSIKNSTNVQTGVGESLVTKLKLYILTKRNTLAEKTLKEKELIDFLKENNLFEFYSTLLNVLIDSKVRKEINRNIEKRIIKCIVPDELAELKWLKKAFT